MFLAHNSLFFILNKIKIYFQSLTVLIQSVKIRMMLLRHIFLMCCLVGSVLMRKQTLVTSFLQAFTKLLLEFL